MNGLTIIQVDFIEYINEHSISEFNGIEFDGDCLSTFYNIMEDPDNPAAPLLKYMIALVRCPMEDVDGLVEMAKGKYADELEIPISDVEEDYLEEMAEEEEEDE